MASGDGEGDAPAGAGGLPSDGWAADPGLPGRWRYRSDGAWTSMTRTGPTAGPADGVGGGAVPAPSPRTGGRTALAVLLASVVVAVGVVAAVVVLRSDGDGAGSPVATPDRGDVADDGTPPSTDDTPTSATTAPGGTRPDDDSTPPSTGDVSGTAVGAGPAADGAGGAVGAVTCPDQQPALLAALRAYAPLSDFADRLSVADPRCTDAWATALASAPETDTSLAIFGRSGPGWVVVRVGDSAPCDGTGIPVADWDALNCNRP